MNSNINKEVDIYHGDRFKLITSNKSPYVIYCQIHIQAQVCTTTPEKMNSIILRLKVYLCPHSYHTVLNLRLHILKNPPLSKYFLI